VEKSGNTIAKFKNSYSPQAAKTNANRLNSSLVLCGFVLIMLNVVRIIPLANAKSPYATSFGKMRKTAYGY